MTESKTEKPPTSVLAATSTTDGDLSIVSPSAGIKPAEWRKVGYAAYSRQGIRIVLIAPDRTENVYYLFPRQIDRLKQGYQGPAIIERTRRGIDGTEITEKAGTVKWTRSGKMLEIHVTGAVSPVYISWHSLRLVLDGDATYARIIVPPEVPA